jgi:hypothetical protein
MMISSPTPDGVFEYPQTYPPSYAHTADQQPATPPDD